MLTQQNSALSTEAPDFLLNCFIRSHSWQHWLSLPLSLLFPPGHEGQHHPAGVPSGLEASLPQPLYYLLSLLSLDIVLCLTVIPKVLAIFWFDLRHIQLPFSFLQMHIMNCFLT
ncbi:Olfactory receptor 56A3 [Plecturocebus cupreus]